MFPETTISTTHKKKSDLHKSGKCHKGKYKKKIHYVLRETATAVRRKRLRKIAMYYYKYELLYANSFNTRDFNPLYII